MLRQRARVLAKAAGAALAVSIVPIMLLWWLLAGMFWPIAQLTAGGFVLLLVALILGTEPADGQSKRRRRLDD